MIVLLYACQEKYSFKEGISVATYRFTPTIRNKVLFHKETVQSIIVDDEISFSSSVGTCYHDISWLYHNRTKEET